MNADHKDIARLEAEIRTLKQTVFELEGRFLAHNESINRLQETKQDRKGPKRAKTD